MTDDHPAYGSGPYSEASDGPTLRHAFPFMRLVYALGFGIVAWLVFWFILVLAAFQFLTRAAVGHTNDELRQFSRSVIAYLQELLAYISLARDERPFPFGPFPKG